MKSKLIPLLAMVGSLYAVQASAQPVHEAKAVTSDSGVTVNVNGKDYVLVAAKSDKELVTGAALVDIASDETITLTGELVVELESLIDATEFAQANQLNLIYVRGNRAILQADENVALHTFKAQVERLNGVINTQIGFNLEGLEAE
ncbi:hypothetical protein [Pseudoalteromonas luteoviolacea]|uniref:ASP external chaperone domain-containing protein n=1 Tax=Pseudoalteromonas luteoviolacea S4054 TaxID=1129367 RepID=A0A0F6AGQ0_9GAMM|nr:hypothetical protein [Pseudoalteromonas luteoviolacea]AOT11223.1 hypothetical protein S4054249_25705 [Pseudoalteromonas luteoviolacea]AOT15613.1 hypothetical protein S40542_22805 [Pseudoalteromonas luteoviolacea]AOT21044.1 hypothetical protein S4054_25625 [Pseudoalteromonas luteoviolacea]KKE84579.1 hypothetical protein N479_08420 [Pseudoalteromonas luteoviolacea S4054]KZN71276.1 hypothetical protein N481_19000 [Pseudoalteromonas luteoviolacea S4047-1]